jgi:probable RNA-binding protein EIF1AD
MAGLGRRSAYRKHLTDSVLNDLPVPGENECIAKIVTTRGGNQFEIITSETLEIPELALLPTKFHKLVWVRRDDYVIVQGASGDDDLFKRGGVRFIINHILYKEQIKHLRSKNLWPKEFDSVNEEEHERQEKEEENDTEEQGSDEEEDEKASDGIVYDQGYDIDEELMANTNRVAAIVLQDSSEEESDGE